MLYENIKKTNFFPPRICYFNIERGAYQTAKTGFLLLLMLISSRHMFGAV